MNQFTYLTIQQIKKKLHNKEISVHELITAHIQHMEDKRNLNSFITENAELALNKAKEVDQKISQNLPLRLMEGVPIGMKDLFCTKGIRTTAGSKILKDFIPPYESTVSQKLINQGAITLGKTNLDEFAMGSANMTSYFDSVVNPWKSSKYPEKNYVPGGSSGGSASAVAAGIITASTGTDTGGSIRQPAAFCGLVGVKPTYGLCSRWGIIAFASSLDQAGPITLSVEDAAIMLETMAGYDEKDSTSINYKVPAYSSMLNANVKNIKIGIPKDIDYDSIDPEILKQWKQNIQLLQKSGAIIKEISMPHIKYSLPVYYILAPAEASSNLARYDGVRFTSRADHCNNLEELYTKTRTEGFGKEVKRRIMIGTYVLSAGHYDAFYIKAQKLRRLIIQDFAKAFQDVDLICTPTTPNTSFAIGEEPKDQISMYMNDVLTVPANIAGLPSISVPIGLSKENLPIGIQFIAPALQELKMFNAGLFIEKEHDFLQNFKKFII